MTKNAHVPMPALQRGLLLSVCLLPLALASAGCGGDAATTVARTTPREIRWSEAKPGSLAGSLQAAVIERPAPDRAWIEAQWKSRGHEGHAGACALTITLPDGVLLLEGETSVPLASEAVVGSQRWLVEFPVGRALDAVLRYCVDTSQGPRAAEVAVRLTDDVAAE